jgi:hypothetical protein
MKIRVRMDKKMMEKIAKLNRAVRIKLLKYEN